MNRKLGSLTGEQRRILLNIMGTLSKIEGNLREMTKLKKDEVACLSMYNLQKRRK